MKKLTCLVVSAALTFSLCLTASGATSKNILTNAGFEKGLEGWEAAHHSTVDVVSTAHSGKKAVRITQAINPDDKSLIYWGRVQQNVRKSMKIKAGEAYLVSAWVKTVSDPDAKAQIYMDMETYKKGAKDPHVDFEVIDMKPINNKGWTLLKGAVRLDTFEHQDGPDTQYKNMIGFYSSPDYVGANRGFDQGFGISDEVRKANVFVMLAPGKNQPCPILVDDVSGATPVYSIVYNSKTSDSKIVYQESGTKLLTTEEDNKGFICGKLADGKAKLIYKFDFTNKTTDANIVLNIANNYRVELATNPNGQWTEIAKSKRDTKNDSNRVDLIIDAEKYLKNNTEKTVYVKIYDGSPDDNKGGPVIRFVEVYSNSGELEFKNTSTSKK